MRPPAPRPEAGASAGRVGDPLPRQAGSRPNRNARSQHLYITGGLPALIRHLENLTLPSGAAFRVEPWQRRFLGGAFRDGVRRAALTCGRSNGKSTFAGAIAAAAAPGGPLYKPGGEVLIVSAGLRQAEIVFRAALGFLGELGSEWSVRRSTQSLSAWHRPSEFRLLGLPCRPRTAHGYHPSLIVSDEPAQWEPSLADDMFDILSTSMAKVEGARMVMIGTWPGIPDNPFRMELERPRPDTYTQIHRARTERLTLANLRAANPAMRSRPALARTLRADMEAAKGGDPTAFKSYVLNLGDFYGRRSELVPREQWEAIRDPEAPAPKGDYLLGIDLGGSRAWSAAAAFHLKQRLLSSFALVGSEPSIEIRAEAECARVEEYQLALDRGELLQVPGRVPKAEHLLEEARRRWGEPLAVISDRFRRGELLDGMDATDWGHIPGQWRGMGAVDGAQDANEFQIAVANKAFRVRPNYALDHCVVFSQTRQSAGGLPVIIKSGRGRDDMGLASVLAVAAAARWLRADALAADSSLEVIQPGAAYAY